MRLQEIADFGSSLPRQLILSGCPGSGKSHRLKELITGSPGVNVVRTTLHSESTYGDFIGTFRPTPLYVEDLNKSVMGPSGEPLLGVRRHLIPVTTYSFNPGPFLKAYVQAWADPNRDVVLLVEEINRANAAAVFGDMLQLLDRNSEGVSHYPLESSSELMAYLRLSLQNEGGDLCRLPSNLFIWATMNRCDESVKHIDSAFLRRWTLHYLPCDGPCAYGSELIEVGSDVMSWDELRTAINSRLLEVGDVEEDKLIGPYFLTQDELADKRWVFMKLVLYIWSDVLPMDRDRFFTEGSLSKLKAKWLAGEPVFIL